ncbi:hypothetical protein BDA99DRAFT_505825 [Phascolomyces articulosus]|uniref:Uncharacterized protein n=1 Tax=Phascolomyces articulosus TaxID=60185 RepID=A0AAD5K2G1_9FUNG|nr:hypothetical protein BDA99DRAFT_505823 [Phascolomyces articulosus]KAI9266490.1 hypothetical protein BDA99DRAFT_505825 [Phascolomyces articulosus]
MVRTNVCESQHDYAATFTVLFCYIYLSSAYYQDCHCKTPEIGVPGFQKHLKMLNLAKYIYWWLSMLLCIDQLYKYGTESIVYFNNYNVT